MFPKSLVPAARAHGRSRWALLLVSAPLFLVACADKATLARPQRAGSGAPGGLGAPARFHPTAGLGAGA